MTYDRSCVSTILSKIVADLTVSKRPGTSYQLEIYSAVADYLYLLFSFVKLVETL